MVQSYLLPDATAINPNYRSGYVAVIGRPNVGKSTLFNHFLQQKIAIISPKPQTTRDQLLGIYTTENCQIIFHDTPGIHKPQHKLGEYMMAMVAETIRDTDVLLWLVDVNPSPRPADRQIADLLQEIHGRHPIQKLVFGYNKIDRWHGKSNDGALAERYAEYLALTNWLDSDRVSGLPISALNGEGADHLLAHLRDLLPVGPQYFPEDQITDLQIRFIAEEIIREKALMFLEQEVPHSIAVMIDEFDERQNRDDDLTYISATLYVERDSQKGIVLGRGGSMIKKIGQAARTDIEELVEGKVYLELWVKVWEKWRKRSGMLRRLGYVSE